MLISRQQAQTWSGHINLATWNVNAVTASGLACRPRAASRSSSPEEQRGVNGFLHKPRVSAARKVFPRSNRLTGSGEYRRVFNNPTRSSDRYFTVLSRPNTCADTARLGLAVSKKILKSAVKRNRMTRIIRESFREVAGDLHSQDVVVLVKKPVETTENAILRRSLYSHWKKLSACEKSSA